MKTLSLLTQQLEEWRQKYQHWYKPRRTVKSRQRKNIRYARHRSVNLVLVLVVAILSLTSVIGYRFYNQPLLTVGKVSPVKIVAPEDGRFEDTRTTQERRKEIQTGIVPILKQNKEVNLQIKLQLGKYLNRIEEARKLASPFPFIDSQIISLASQQFLRSCSEAKFKEIVEQTELEQSSQSFSVVNNNLKTSFNPLVELKTYRQQVEPEQFKELIAQITISRYRYDRAWKKITDTGIGKVNEEEINTLLNIEESAWQQTKNSILLATERMLAQGIAPGIPFGLLEKAVKVQLGNTTPQEAIAIASNLLLDILRPNLETDREATRNMAEKAALAIAPAVVEIEKGEIIVSEGEVISQPTFVLLDGFGLSRRRVNWLGLGSSGVVVVATVSFFLLWQKRINPFLRGRDYILLCLLSLSAPILAIFNIPYTNLSAIGLLTSSFYSPALAVCLVSLLSGLMGLVMRVDNWVYLLAGTAGGILAAAIAGRLRSREAIAKLGLGVGLTQGAIYLIATLILSATAGTIWYAVLPRAIVCGLSGVAWSIIALGISPYLENIFDVVTSIRLAELSNPNLPLLKRLATEAPGTFQHTMFVASLAEAAARELNCNVELVRAGTLYHDIGKMHDPLGFIENQMGANKHDEIDDPWISAQIIKKHVSEGLVLARKYKLPKAIKDFIPQHQGTLLISYFYHQAKQRCSPTEAKILESDFRYDGPIPQSREAAIMMLADGCEAALRSLKDVTPERALITIQKIFKARWYDGQLVDSGLGYEELPKIAEVFVKVWQQCNHKRIVYPKGALDTPSSRSS